MAVKESGPSQTEKNMTTVGSSTKPAAESTHVMSPMCCHIINQDQLPLPVLLVAQKPSHKSVLQHPKSLFMQLNLVLGTCSAVPLHMLDKSQMLPTVCGNPERNCTAAEIPGLSDPALPGDHLQASNRCADYHSRRLAWRVCLMLPAIL